jgi:6,7-dimethyl-8-ribityllumazine synthase
VSSTSDRSRAAPAELRAAFAGAPPRVAIVEARFHAGIGDALALGAQAALESAGAISERHEVPGALEIPLAIRILLEAGLRRPSRSSFDGYVALGCVIRGETGHYDIVVNESARGLTDLAVAHGLAIGNGILTVENEAQAWERARSDRLDKGGDAARACLAMIAMRRRLGIGATP